MKEKTGQLKEIRDENCCDWRTQDECPRHNVVRRIRNQMIDNQILTIKPLLQYNPPSNQN
jgi:hypothetical protein